MASRRGTLVTLSGLLLGIVALNQWAPRGPVASSANAIAGGNAMYCVGLTSAGGQAPGQVVFANTSGQPRTLSVTVSAIGSSHAPVQRTLTIAPHARATLVPTTYLRGTTYAVAAYASGNGVVGEEVLRSTGTNVACATGGVAQWYAAGLSTANHSVSTLTLYNPTATAAVFSVAALESRGIAQPAPFQGLTVGPHGMTTVNLESEIVTTANFAVRVTMLRGALVVEGTQTNIGAPSLIDGQAPSTVAHFDAVPTAQGAIAQLALGNPSTKSVQVTVSVRLPGFTIAPQSVMLPPLASGLFHVTPNTLIPAKGEAAVQISATAPVVVNLLTGGKGLQLTTPDTAQLTWTLLDETGKGYATVIIGSTSSNALPVTLTAVHGAAVTTWSGTLAAGTTSSLAHVFPQLHSFRDTTLVLHAKAPVTLTATLPTHPSGIVLIRALSGR